MISSISGCSKTSNTPTVSIYHGRSRLRAGQPRTCSCKALNALNCQSDGYAKSLLAIKLHATDKKGVAPSFDGGGIGQPVQIPSSSDSQLPGFAAPESLSNPDPIQNRSWSVSQV